jgi:hypothetical protein
VHAAGVAHRVEEGIGSAYAAAPELGSSAPSVLDSAREALVDGWRLSMWVGVGLAAVTFVYLAVWGPRRGEAGVIPDPADAEIGSLDSVVAEPIA